MECLRVEDAPTPSKYLEFSEYGLAVIRLRGLNVSEPTITFKYTAELFLNIVGSIGFVPVSPKSIEKNPLLTVVLTAKGVLVVPAAEYSAVPAVGSSYKIYFISCVVVTETPLINNLP